MRSSLHRAAAARAATPARYNLPTRLPEGPGTPPPPGAEGWGGKDMLSMPLLGNGGIDAIPPSCLASFILAPYPKFIKYGFNLPPK